MVDIRQLRYFVAVAEELHFGRAAERLHMAQSPLSQQILQLEKEVGVVLLERQRRVIGLTDAGAAMLDAAREVLALLDSGLDSARRAARGEVGGVRVGYLVEMTVDLLPLSLKRFNAALPEIEIQLLQGTTSGLLEGLRRKHVDVAFVRSPLVPASLRYEPLSRERLCVATPDDPAGAPSPVDLFGLEDGPLILPDYQAAGGLRRDIEAAFEEEGCSLVAMREASTVSASLLLVAAGAGFALVPETVARSHPLPGVRYLPLARPLKATSGIAWRREESSPIVERFVCVAREVARDSEG